MLPTSSSRFVVCKDASEHQSQLPTAVNTAMPPATLLSPTPAPALPDIADADFAKYSKADFSRIPLLTKSYKDPTVFLADIDWKTILAASVKYAAAILESTSEKRSKGGYLAIAELPPLFMVATGELLRAYGFPNVTYSFSRPFFVNSESKGFESGLFLSNFRADSVLGKLFKDASAEFAKLALSKHDPAKTYLFFTENAVSYPSSSSGIDPYVKTQVGYKETPPVFRIDKYPSIDFLRNKNVSEVGFFDVDATAGRDFAEYREDVEKAGIKVVSKNFGSPSGMKSISAFDDYLVVKSKEYRKYRETIVDSASKNVSALTANNWADTAPKKKIKDGTVPVSSGKSVNTDNPFLIPYLVGTPFLIIAFLMVDVVGWSGFLGAPNATGTGKTSTGATRSTGNHYWYGSFGNNGGGSSWSSGGSSSASSSKSSGSSVRSF